MKKVLISLMTTFFVASMLNSVDAYMVYQTTNLGGGRWENNYTIMNDFLASDIDEFTVFFDYGLYDNLTVTSPLAGWDEITVNPALIFGSPDIGFYDALALGPGIAPWATMSGFSVSFDWRGAGTPGTQYFEIVDPVSFSTLASGFTAPIPEPGTMILLGISLSSFWIYHRKRY